MPQTKRPTAAELLRARATVARRLVRDGRLHPADALALAVWPTADTCDVERFLSRGTVATRAYGPRADA